MLHHGGLTATSSSSPPPPFSPTPSPTLHRDHRVLSVRQGARATSAMNITKNILNGGCFTRGAGRARRAAESAARVLEGLQGPQHGNRRLHGQFVRVPHLRLHGFVLPRRRLLLWGGSGTASGKGKCCGNHREGSQCDRCVAGYWGGNCSACPGLVDRSATGESNIICSGHGSCSQGLAGNGSCTCETGFNGADCGSCEASFCPNQCSSHGACECSEGKKPACKCDGGWGGDYSCGTCEEGLAGKDCGTCAAGWYGGTAAEAKAGASLQCKKCACVLGTCDEGTHGTGICSTGVPPAAIIGGVAGAVIIGAIVVYVLFCKKKDAHAAPMLREPMMGAGPMAGIQQQQPAHVPVPPPAGSMAVPPPFVPAQQQQQQQPRQ